MNIIDLIIKKKDKKELSAEEINFFVESVCTGAIPDYQISSMLMAICINSLTERETADLTKAMTNSGKIMKLDDIPSFKADKHSTGGVADTTTLIIAPLCASLGLPIVKMSGRGLGHTGGTLDKLESIPGFNVNISMEKAIEQAKKHGIVLMSQSDELAPADKYIYAIRDVTGTVNSIPLIASSIMSKKLASGTDGIVLDIKCGKGAFMKDIDSARALAEEMIRLGRGMGKKMSAVITNMDEPLGMNIGSSLEVIEAIEVLKGNRHGALREVSLAIGAEMLVMGGIAGDTDEALDMLKRNIQNSRGLYKFAELISLQGGNPAVIDNYSLFPQRVSKSAVISEADGYISELDALSIGKAAAATGAGRQTKNAVINYGAGIMLKKRTGDRVTKGEILARIFAESSEMCADAERIMKSGIRISDKKPDKKPLIYEVIR